MPNVNPYYVGTSLSDIGSNMSRDRGYESQQAIAQMQMRQQQAAQIRQAMMERDRMAQQQNQFQQEMAYRNANMGQDSSYRNSILSLKEREFNAGLGLNPRDIADDKYRYAALENDRNIANQRYSQVDSRLAVEQQRQAGINNREMAIAQEVWDTEESDSRSRASQYNALVEDIKARGKKMEKKNGMGWDDPDSRKLLSEETMAKSYAELNQILSLDQRPGKIIQDPITKRFQSISRPRPGGPRVGGSVNPGFANNPVGFNVPNGTNAATYSPIVSAVAGTDGQDANRPVKVRTSDGQIWDTVIGMFGTFKRRDPGAQVITNPPPAEIRSGVATGSWGPPSPYRNPANMDAMLRALN